MRITVALFLLSLGATSAFVSQQSNPAARVESQLFARKPFITGNWKLNPQTKAEAIELATGIVNAVTSESPCDVAIFVPFHSLNLYNPLSITNWSSVPGYELRCSPKNVSLSI
jgi:hypothetical protein